MRVTAGEKKVLRDLEGELGAIRLGQPSALAQTVEPMRQLLDVESLLIWTPVEQVTGLLDIERYHFAGSHDGDGLRRNFRHFFATSPRRYAWYDPTIPEPAQRNRLLDALDLSTEEEFAASRVCREVLAPIGVHRHREPRALLCEGPSLLAWFGAFQEVRITGRQSAFMRRLMRMVRRRLLVERQLLDAPRRAAAIEANLEHLGVPAFLVGAQGTILAASASGRALLERRGLDVGASLRDCVNGRAAVMPFELTPLGASGTPRHWLATLPARTRDARAATAIDAAAKRWALTPRQTAVLAQLSTGVSTTAIAARLKISVRAVELHLTAMFDRVGVDSRAALIASVLLAIV